MADRPVRLPVSPVAMRPVWLQIACARCDRRAAVKLSDVFDGHRADYVVHRCPDCNAVRSFERFTDATGLAWRRRSIYQEVAKALDRLAPSKLAQEPAAVLRPRERIARCMKELQTLDRYQGLRAPKCDDCGVDHEILEGDRPHDYAITCLQCGEHPTAYRLVVAASAGARAAFAGGIACPACAAAVDVTALVDAPPPRPTVAQPAAERVLQCPACGLVMRCDADVRASSTRTLVRLLTAAFSGDDLRAARLPEGSAPVRGPDAGGTAPGPHLVSLKSAALKRDDGS